VISHHSIDGADGNSNKRIDLFQLLFCLNQDIYAAHKNIGISTCSNISIIPFNLLQIRHLPVFLFDGVVADYSASHH